MPYFDDEFSSLTPLGSIEVHPVDDASADRESEEYLPPWATVVAAVCGVAARVAVNLVASLRGRKMRNKPISRATSSQILSALYVMGYELEERKHVTLSDEGYSQLRAFERVWRRCRCRNRNGSVLKQDNGEYIVIGGSWWWHSRTPETRETVENFPGWDVYKHWTVEEWHIGLVSEAEEKNLARYRYACALPTVEYRRVAKRSWSTAEEKAVVRLMRRSVLVSEREKQRDIADVAAELGRSEASIRNRIRRIKAADRRRS